MTTLLIALLMGSMSQAPAGAMSPTAAGNIETGKTAWTSPALGCRNCHGDNGEGGFGPDLAGRGLSADQIKRSVRKPWGVMPAFTEKQISDSTMADLAAYFASLPKVAQPAASRYLAPEGAPAGQRLSMDSYGCANCHQAELAAMRRALGREAKEATFDQFKKLVYQHTDEYPNGRMGNFSPDRLPEPALKTVFDYLLSLGLRVPVAATVGPVRMDGANAVYTLTLKNDGFKEKGGLTAEDLTISLALPAGSTVVSTTGAGYQGVKHDAQANTDSAVWTLARIAPEEVQTYSVTLTGGASAKGLGRASIVRWAKPQLRDRPGAPQLTMRDARIPDKGDQAPVTLPAAP